MSAAADTSTTSPRQNPFEAARDALIARLQSLAIPQALGDVSDHLKDVANVCDQWLHAVGAGVADHVSTDVDMRLFSGQFLGAVDGNASYEVDCVVERTNRRRSFARRAV